MFLKDSVHTFIIRVFAYVFALLVQVVIARSLGPDGKGELAIVILLMTLSTLLVGMGMERAIIFNIGKNRFSLKKIWSNSCTFLTISFIIVSALLVPIWYFIKPFFGEVRFELILLMLIVVPLDRMYTFQLGVFNGSGEIRKGNIYTFLFSFLYAVFIAVFLLFVFKTPEGVIYSYFCAYLIVVLVVFYRWRKKPDLSFSYGFDPKVVKSMLGFGVKGQIGNITNLIATKTDLLILNYFLGKATAGVYSVAINLSDLLLFLPFIFSYVIFPHASRRETEDAWKLTGQVSRMSFLGTIVLALVIAGLAPIIVPLLFSEDFSGAVQPLWILLPGFVCISTVRLLAAGLSGVGFPLYYSVCTIVIVISTITLNLILVPKYQMTGAAVASSISYLIGLILILSIIKVKFKLAFNKFLIFSKQDFTLIIENLRKLINR